MPTTVEMLALVPTILWDAHGLMCHMHLATLPTLQSLNQRNCLAYWTDLLLQCCIIASDIVFRIDHTAIKL